MLRALVVAAAAAALLALPAAAASTPVGPLPKGPTTTITVSKGSLVSIALPSRAGKSWRFAGRIVPARLAQVGEADVGPSVVIVYRAKSRGVAVVRYGLTRGETAKAYASATFRIRIS
jgi:hypothetical protein